MDKDEAQRLLNDQLSELQRKTYEELRTSLLSDPQTFEVVGESGTRYQLEVRALWDSAPEGDLRVPASIDDGGWRSLRPLTESFIIAPQ